MAAIEELLGATVKNHKGEDLPVSSFSGSGKVVGLYFSAHWCPPCRGFTPKLAEFYTKMKAQGKEFEIIFISSDRDDKSFNEYFESMPWLALDFGKRDIKEKIAGKYKISGIPSFVVLDGSSGETITTDGRESVTSDPEGANFPWRK